MHPDSKDWNVLIEDGGRAGYLEYREPGHAARMSWELGGEDAVAIIASPPPQDWDTLWPWTAGRRGEVMERVAGEVIRQRCPNCVPSFGDDMTTIVLRREDTLRESTVAVRQLLHTYRVRVRLMDQGIIEPPASLAAATRVLTRALEAANPESLVRLRISGATAVFTLVESNEELAVLPLHSSST